MPRKKAPEGIVPRFLDVLRTREGRVLLRVAGAAMVFLAVSVIMRQTRAHAHSMGGYVLTPTSVSFSDLPSWMDARTRRLFRPQALAAHAGRFQISIYDPRAEDLIAGHIERHPMIRRVREVSVEYPNKATLRFAPRMPVAWVPLTFGKKKVHVLLSDDHCLLDPRPYHAYLKRLPVSLPVVNGIRARPPMVPGAKNGRLRIGSRWEDGDAGQVEEAVAAGLLAARLHREFSGHLHVKSIDVGRFTPEGRLRDDPNRGEVRLVLSCPPERRGGERVLRSLEWGRTTRASDEVAAEDPFEVKLERLRRRLMGSRVPRELDVRMWDPATGI